MSISNLQVKQQEQAADCLGQAARLIASNDYAAALPLLHQAVLLYAEVYRLAGEEEGVTTLLTRARAEVCRQYGDALAHQERHPQAASVFQEAADLYGLLSAQADRQAAQACARKALASVTALRANPQDRLLLLIARYERQRQQFAMQTDTWEQQADCCLHIARIFLRRDRNEEAFMQYTDAQALYGRAEQTASVLASQAECHHRLGNLLANVLIDAPDRIAQAIAHYEQALAVYANPEVAAQGVQEDHLLCARALSDLRRRALAE